MAVCPQCGTENKDGVKFCKGCGTSLTAPQTLKPCAGCGAGLLANAKFCKKCGTPAAPSANPQAVPPAQPASAPDDTATMPEREPPAAAASAPAIASTGQASEQLRIQPAPAASVSLDDTEILTAVSASETVTLPPAASRAAATSEIAAGIDDAPVQAPPAMTDGEPHAMLAPARAASPDTTTPSRTMAGAAPAATSTPPVHETRSAPQTTNAADDAMVAPTKPKSPVSTVLAIGAVAVAVAGAGGFYWWHSSKPKAQPQTADSVAATPSGSVAQPVPATPSAPAAHASVTLESRTDHPDTAPRAPAARLPVESEAPKVVNVPAATVPTTTVPAAAAPVMTAPTATVPSAPVGQHMAPKTAAQLPDELPKPVHGQRPVAARRSETAVEASPTPVRSDPIAAKVSTLLVKADSYLANRQYDKAIATAESALELDPTRSSARAVISIAKSRQAEALRSGSSLE